MESNFVVLKTAHDGSTPVPTVLAKAAHRVNAGDCLALLTEDLEHGRMFVCAMPALDMRPRKPFTMTASPYGRLKRVERISGADAAYLRGKPAASRSEFL